MKPHKVKKQDIKLTHLRSGFFRNIGTIKGWRLLEGWRLHMNNPGSTPDYSIELPIH